MVEILLIIIALTIIFGTARVSRVIGSVLFIAAFGLWLFFMYKNIDKMLEIILIATPFIATFAFVIYVVRLNPRSKAQETETIPPLQPHSSATEIARLKELHALALRDYGPDHSATSRWAEKLREHAGEAGEIAVKIAETERNIETLRGAYGPKHPGIAALKVKLKALKAGENWP